MTGMLQTTTVVIDENMEMENTEILIVKTKLPGPYFVNLMQWGSVFSTVPKCTTLLLLWLREFFPPATALQNKNTFISFQGHFNKVP